MPRRNDRKQTGTPSKQNSRDRETRKAWITPKPPSKVRPTGDPKTNPDPPTVKPDAPKPDAPKPDAPKPEK